MWKLGFFCSSRFEGIEEEGSGGLVGEGRGREVQKLISSGFSFVLFLWRIIFPFASCLKRQFGMEWESEGRSAYGIGVGGHGSKSAVLHQPYCRI